MPNDKLQMLIQNQNFEITDTKHGSRIRCHNPYASVSYLFESMFFALQKREVNNGC